MKKLLSMLLVVVLSMAAFIGCNNVTDDKNVEITLSETAITLAIGDQHALTATVTGSEENVTWASSNASVVKVNCAFFVAFTNHTDAVFVYII